MVSSKAIQSTIHHKDVPTLEVWSSFQALHDIVTMIFTLTYEESLPPLGAGVSTPMISLVDSSKKIPISQSIGQRTF